MRRNKYGQRQFPLQSWCKFLGRRLHAYWMYYHALSIEPKFRDCKLYMKASSAHATSKITLTCRIGLPYS